MYTLYFSCIKLNYTFIFITFVHIFIFRCTVVFHNPVLGSETHLSNICRKSITCLTFSSDGRYLGTGECGHQSNVRVWDMADFTQIAEFPGHKYGINCVVSFKYD